MKALVVYESMFGNTERVAERIAQGLRTYAETDLVDVAASPRAQAGDYDVIVVGAPTHALSLSTHRSRRDAWLRGARAGVMQRGLRDWLDELAPPHAAVTAAFDTRTHRTRRLPGSAAKAANRLLRKKGAASLARAHTFYTAHERGPLVEGELDRAQAWGEALALLAGAPKRGVGSRP